MLFIFIKESGVKKKVSGCNEQSTEGERSDEPKCSLFT